MKTALPKRLAQLVLTDADTIIFTAVDITIIKDISMCSLNDSALISIALLPQGATLANQHYLYKNLLLQLNETLSLENRNIVLATGDSLVMRANFAVAASVFGVEFSEV